MKARRSILKTAAKKAILSEETFAMVTAAEKKRAAELEVVRQSELKQAEEYRRQGVSEDRIANNFKKVMKEAIFKRFAINKDEKRVPVEDKEEEKDDKQEFTGELIDAVKNGMSLPAIKELLAAKKINAPAIESKYERKTFDINEVDEDGATVLHHAVLTRRPVVGEDVELVKLLLAHGADPRICNQEGQNLLEMAAEEEKEAAMMLFLLNAFPLQCTNEKSAFLKNCFQQKQQLYYNRAELFKLVDELVLFNVVTDVSFYAKYPERFFDIFNKAYTLGGSAYKGKLIAILDNVMDARIVPTPAELDVPFYPRSIALSRALAKSCHPDILRYMMSRGADPRDLITSSASVPGGIKKHLQSSMLVIALSKANLATIQYLLDAFPLQCRTSSHIPFALQAHQIMQHNKNLTEKERCDVLSRVTELESYMTQTESAVYFGLPAFIKIIEKADSMSSSFYHEDILKMIRDALRIISQADTRAREIEIRDKLRLGKLYIKCATEIEIHHKLRFLEGKLLFKKYLSYKMSGNPEELKMLAAAFSAWSTIKDPKYLSVEDNLMLAKLFLSVENDSDVAACISYTNPHQRQMRIFNHLRCAKTPEEKAESKASDDAAILLEKLDSRFADKIISDAMKFESIAMTTSIAERAHKRMGWESLDNLMWKFLRYLVKNNLLGNEASPAYKLYIQLVNHKLKAEKDTPARAENLHMMSVQITETATTLAGKAGLKIFPGAKDGELSGIVKELQTSLNQIAASLRASATLTI